MLHLDHDLIHALGLRVHALRDIENPAHLAEDLDHLRAGILDPTSFLAGYTHFEHCFELRVHDAAGNLKYIRRAHNLRTNAGGDWQAALMGQAAGVPTQYIALSNDATTPNPADTTLAGEITTGGLARSLLTYAHTTVTGGSPGNTTGGTFSLSGTLNATATATTQKAGFFTASSGGTMPFELAYTPVTVNAGDVLTPTYTIAY